MRFRGFLTLCVVMLLASAAFAQEQGGSITGVVKDAQGGVLPGVTVEARSAQVVGVSTAVTDAEGVYRFPALPPGTYEITASLQGFAAAKSAAVVGIGQNLKIDLALGVAGVSESVQVTGESPLIDMKQNASFATIGRDVIDRIPKGRDFTDVITMAPGANAETKAGGIQVDGASGSENRFIIDGMDTTELRTGVSGKTMLIDFIQEVQVKSSGYNAEFGGATGGVVSAITKSGSNSFRGSLGLYEQNNRFAGSLSKRPSYSYSPWVNATSGKAEPQTGLISRATPWQYLSAVADLGGPIFKDRVWFYGGMAYTKNDYNIDTWFVGEPGHPMRNFQWGSWAYYPNYNLTTQLSNSIRLRLTGSNQRNHARKTGPGFNYDNRIYDGNPATSSGCTAKGLADMVGKSLQGSTGTNAPAFLNADCTVNQTTFDNTYVKTWNTGLNAQPDSRNDVFSGNLDWVITPTFFVNSTAGLYRTNSWGNPDWVGNATRRFFNNANFDSNMLSPEYRQLNGQPWPLVPAAYQSSTGDSAQNLSSRLLVRDVMTRLYFNANMTYFKSFAGQHVFKTGARIEQFGNDIYNARTKPEITFYFGRTYNATDGRNVQGKYGYYMLNKTGTVGKVTSNNYSFWLQDSWAVNSRLTINAGVRAENEIVPSYKDTPDAIDIKFGFKDKIAPRVGFAWDIKGDSKWKAYGSFGLFFDITKLELPRGSFGGDHWINYYWTLDTYDWASISCDEGNTGCPGTFVEAWDARRSSNQPDPDLAAYFKRPGMTGIDPAMKPVRSGEYTFGLDHELNPTMSVSARYVHKWLTRTIEDVGLLLPGIGEIYIIANPGFGYTEVMMPDFPKFPTPKATRDYDGIEFRLRKRYANRWSAEVDYTYSRLWGNYGGLASSDENGRVSPNVNRYYDHLYMSYDQNNQAVYGLLPTDRPHVAKLQATYDLPWGTNVGAFAIVQSGQPQSSTLTYAGYPIYYNGRNDLGRTPLYKQVDLNLQHEFRLGGARRLILQANVTNALDLAGYTGLYTTSPYRSGVTPPNSDAVFFGGPWTAAKLVAERRAAGLTILDSDFYNKLDARQGRRQIRFQAKFSF